MARKSDFTLPPMPVDAIFSTQAERDDALLERVHNIPLEELHPFKDHPFKIQSGEEMDRMIESIRKVGAITPALARPLEDGGFELISGHRRLAACQVLGLKTMPVIVREMTDDEIAKKAEFFCFGTNDLTQMTFGFSRDDAGKFLTAYYDSKIYENDPFAKLDQNGVGKLMDMAVTLGKKVRPEMHCGICGEHGGDPVSVEFCHKIGLNYVSCSPFRVPIARLAAAQAAIKYGED